MVYPSVFGKIPLITTRGRAICQNKPTALGVELATATGLGVPGVILLAIFLVATEEV